MKKRLIIYSLLISSSFLACKTASVYNEFPEDHSLQKDSDTKGRQLIDDVISANNYNAFNYAETYTFQAVDNWKNIVSLMNQDITPDEKNLAFRLIPNTFDGQLFVYNKDSWELKKRYGLQAWHPYKISKDNEVQYDVSLSEKKLLVFGLTNYHFTMELPNRLRNVPIVRYLGKQEKFGTEYDAVFASWGESTTEAYDQFILYIHPQKKRVEVMYFTIRESPSPFPKNLSATYRLTDFTEVDQGLVIPTKIYAMINKGNDDLSKALHYFTIDPDTFKFDEFPASDLRPNPTLPDLGESKPY